MSDKYDTSQLTPVSYHFTKDVSNPVRLCSRCGSTYRRLPCLVGQGVSLMMDLCPLCDKEATRRTLEEMGLRLVDEPVEVDSEEFLMDDEDDGTLPLTPKLVAGLLGFLLSIVLAGNLIGWIVNHLK